MFPVEKILCPVDFSEHSLYALQTATEMAAKFSAKLYLMHVLTPVPIMPTSPHPVDFDVPGYQKELEKNAQKNLDELLKNKIPGDVQAEKVLKLGSPAHEINKFAEDEQLDLVVVSTHGHTGLQHLVFGSVAEKIIRHAHCPVLTLRSFEK